MMYIRKVYVKNQRMNCGKVHSACGLRTIERVICHLLCGNLYTADDNNHPSNNFYTKLKFDLNHA